MIIINKKKKYKSIKHIIERKFEFAHQIGAHKIDKENFYKNYDELDYFKNTSYKRLKELNNYIEKLIEKSWRK